MRRLPFLTLTVLAGLSIIRPASAQGPVRDALGPFRESVAIHVDSQVVRSIETAREHLAQQQWSEAIPILQQLIESRESSLIPIETGRYINSADYCQLLISLLPDEGLAAYREQVDPRFRERFEQAQQSLDADELAAILRSAFHCSFGAEALWLLADLQFERGDYAAARETLELLVPSARQAPAAAGDAADESRPQPVEAAFLTCRDVDIPPETVLSRLILCSIFEGDMRRASLELDAFAARFSSGATEPATTATALIDPLTIELRQSATWAPLRARQDTTFGGSPHRNPSPGSAVRPARVVWRRSIPPSAFRGPQVRPLLADERPLSLHPLVVDEHVCVATSEAVYAFDLATGRPAWSTDDADSGAIYHSSTAGNTRLHLPDTGVPAFTLSTANGRLFARLGAPILRKSPHETTAVSEIVGLDLRQREGQLDLRITANAITPEIKSAEATTWSFEGTPLVSGGRLYASLRQGAPEDRTVVACFDARTGRLNWQTRVAASLSNLPDHFNLLGTNLLTLDNGRVFLTTGTGAIVALDADTGRTLWVVTYESTEPESLEAFSDPRRVGLAPCLCAQGVVYAAPQDSDLLFALEAATGRLVWSRRVLTRPLQLVAARNGRLFVADDALQAFDLLTGDPAWPRKLAFADCAGQVFGRPVITDEAIIWPQHDELLYVAQTDGRLVDRINLRQRFGISAGNLLLHNDRLIIAQPDALVLLSAADSPASDEPTVSEAPTADDAPAAE